MKEESTYLTKAKYDEFEKELEQLIRVRRKEIAEALEYAKALGDLSENAEYHEARGEQAAVEDRIAKLEQIIKSAVIIKEHETDKVSIGSKITIRKSGEKDKKIFTIVSPEESDVSEGKISVKSPIGEAALNKKKGEEFSFKTPSGLMTFEVLGIE
ncbi:MAG TPA: transcription elongation factor GreA [Candidatus Paceibacterota bacterium]